MLNKTTIRKQAQRAVPLNGEKCSKCGSQTGLTRHHEDYSKPLNVVDPVSLMPLDTPWERAGDEADSLPNVRLDVHTDEDSQVGHLQQPGMPQEVGRDVCCETLGQSGYDGKLRVLPDGIHQDTPAPDDMRSVVWQQAGMAEKAMTNRTQRLKCIGNGVVAAQAGFAACILIARATGAFQ